MPLKDVTSEELKSYFDVDARCSTSERKPFASDEQGHLIGSTIIDAGILEICEGATIRGLASGLSVTSITVSLFVNFFQMGREFERKRIEIEQLQQLVRDKREEIL